MKMEKILVVVAHPDDEVLGMGGSIAKFSAEGKQVHLLIVTDGSSSQYRDSKDLCKIIENKKIETTKSADILGIKSITYGELPDMRLDSISHVLINEVIEKAVREIKPDTVFTHFWGDVNMDHRRVYESTMVAVRPQSNQIVKNVLCYSVPSSTEWSPNVLPTMYMPNYFVDIEGFDDKKYDAMACYETECRAYPHPRSIEHIRKQDNAEGLKIGRESAESFVLLRSIV